MKTSRIIGIVLLSILAVTILSWGGYALSVALSGPKGVGDAIKQKNSAANWTAAQAKFEKLYAGIQSADQKTELAAERLAVNPTDLTLQQQHAGVQSGCITLVADYNAESNKFLAADFKDSRLPYQIETNKPQFDCK